MRTYTQEKFSPLNPHVNNIYIEDIGHSLSNLCRYTGHCPQFYSVAQHSLLVSDFCPKELKLWGLLHDAAEAYLWDILSEIKHKSILGVIYQMHENKLLKVIAKRFNLDYPIPKEVKDADKRIYNYEIQLFIPNGKITPLCPPEAKEAFLNRFSELWHQLPRRQGTNQ